jgi:hypothetical protein
MQKMITIKTPPGIGGVKKNGRGVEFMYDIYDIL